MMDFETWFNQNEADLYEMGTVDEIALAAWKAAQEAKRERIKSRVSLAANAVWQIGKESTCPVYTGPQEHLLDDFVNVLIGEDE